MSEANRLKIKAQIQQESAKRQMPQAKIYTMKQALAFIESKNFEPRLQAELIKRFSRYPANSLNNALKKLPQIVVEITAKQRAEDQKNTLLLNKDREEDGKEDQRHSENDRRPADAGSTDLHRPNESQLPRTDQDGSREENRPTRRSFSFDEEEPSEASIPAEEEGVSSPEVDPWIDGSGPNQT
jgi:hypothetical protein